MKKVCLNKKIFNENKDYFNIEIEDGNRYDQKESLRCWIYAGINMIKQDIAKNLYISGKELKLSINYLNFFDKLEKSYEVYQEIINLEDNTLETINKTNFFNFIIPETGNFQYFRNLVNKYGLIPDECYRETKDSLYSKELNIVLTKKIKKDVLILRNEKLKQNLKKIIDKMLEENYILLSKI